MKRIYGVGKLLAAEIKKYGLKKGFVAKEAGLSASALSNYIEERNGIPEPILKSILFTFPQFDSTILKKGKAPKEQQVLPLQMPKEAVNK